MIAVIFNPSARGNKARSFLRQLATLGAGCRLLPTEQPGHAIHLATQSAREGAWTVVAAGGDGTVNEVVNGLMQAARETCLPPPRLAILPLGTVNVFARELLLPASLDRAWHWIHHGKERVVDVPFAEWQGQRRWFIQLGGAGLDAHAIARVRWGLKKRVGKFAYVWAGWEALQHPSPDIELDTGHARHSGPLILIGNGRHYGGAFPVFRNARLDDRQLDVLLFPRISLLTLARTAWAARFNREPAPGDALHFQLAAFSLTGPPGLPFQLEGDNIGTLPARFAVDPTPLRVLVPA